MRVSEITSRLQHININKLNTDTEAESEWLQYKESFKRLRNTQYDVILFFAEWQMKKLEV